MKYPYSVKQDGVWYAAGEEIPAAKPVENPVKVQEQKITKGELMRMNAADVRAVARETGIDAQEYTRSELIQMLVDKLGL